MRRALFALAAPAFAVALVPPPAVAEGGFLDCNTPQFLAYADPQSGAFKCEELSRQELAIRGHTVPLRVIKHADTDQTFFTIYAPEAVEAIKKAFDSWLAIRDLRTAPVTVLLYSPEGYKFAEKVPFADAHTPFGGDECVIRVAVQEIESAPAVKGEPERTGIFFAKVLTHETFHCVQAWNFHPKPGTQAAWWVEGSAMLAADILYDPMISEMETYHAFDQTIAKTPLTEMSYEAAPFWHWLWSEDQGRVFTLLDTLATSAAPDLAAQAETLTAFLGEEGLQKFAQSYIDGRVVNPQGTKVTSPVLPAEQSVSDTTKIAFASTAMTIQARPVAIEGGDYIALEYGGLGKVYERAPEGGWKTLQMEISPPDCTQPVHLLYARMMTPDDARRGDSQELELRRTSECKQCVALQEHDQCMAGQWAVANDEVMKLIQYAGSDLEGVTYDSVAGEVYLDFTDTGVATVTTNEVTIGATIRRGELEAKLTVDMDGQDTGLWSTGGESLAYCKTAAGIEIQSEVNITNGNINVTKTRGLLGNQMFTFACSGDSAVLTAVDTVLADGAPPQWHLTRTKQGAQ